MYKGPLYFTVGNNQTITLRFHVIGTSGKRLLTMLASDGNNHNFHGYKSLYESGPIGT